MAKRRQIRVSAVQGCSDVLNTFVNDCECREPSHMTWYKETGQVIYAHRPFGPAELSSSKSTIMPNLQAVNYPEAGHKLNFTINMFVFSGMV
ncbi:MAG: hypothetical protein GXY41_05525 [Phycisphaerae bacterium]|jgi:hypothetical protein|nr:hypothetical protein [Phycisphaerae bacterium]